MTSTTTSTTTTQTHLTSKDRTMNPDPRHLIRTLLTIAATFLGLLLLVALWTVYGPAYDAQATTLVAAPSDISPTQAPEPCPAGEAGGDTCGSDGDLESPDASPSPDAPTAPQRRCKGCRLSQEEYDARQADKQAAHDRAEARKQRGAERRAEAQRKREERASRKASKTSTSKSSNSRGSSSHHTHPTGSESSSDGPAAQDGTSTPADTSSPSQAAPEASTDAAASDDTGSDSTDFPSSSASAPYTPLEIPEASRRPAPYDASKDPFEVRREAARQAADAINHPADQVRAPTTTTTTPDPTASNGYWAEQMPTWALGLIGFFAAAAGLIAYKASRPNTRGDRRS